MPEKFFSTRWDCQFGSLPGFFCGTLLGVGSWDPLQGVRCLVCSFRSPPGVRCLGCSLDPLQGVRCLGCSLDPLRGCGVLAAPFNRGKCPGQEKLTFRCPKSFFPQGEIANLGPFRFFFAGPSWGSVPWIPSRGCGVLVAPFDPLRGCGVLVGPWIPSQVRCLGCSFGSPPGGAVSWLLLGSCPGVRCLGGSLDPPRGCGVLAAPWIPSGGAVSWLLLWIPSRGCGVLVAPWIPSGGAVSWWLLGSPPGVRCLGAVSCLLLGSPSRARCLGCSLDPLRGCGVLVAPWIPFAGAVPWLLLGSPPGGAVSWLLLRSPPGVRCLGCSLDPLRGRGALVAPLDPLP